MQLLKHEISAAGFFAGLVDTSTVSSVAIGGTDCAASDWATDIISPLDMVDNVVSGVIPTAVGANVDLTCVEHNDLIDGSDILTVKRTADLASLDNGVEIADSADHDQWYLKRFDYSDYSWVYLDAAIPDDEKTAGSTYDYWEYYAKVYYLRDFSVSAGDDIPTLCEARLLEDKMEPRCLVEGIEDMQLELGVDNNGDGVADRYLSSPASTDIGNAVSIRIFLLVRSINEVPQYTNNKTYQLGAKAIAAKDDGYIRKVFTTTVKLRNNLNHTI